MIDIILIIVIIIGLLLLYNNNNIIEKIDLPTNNNLYDEIETLIDKHLNDKYYNKLNVSIPENTSKDNFSSNIIKEKINSSTDTVWNTYDKIINNNRNDIMKDQIDNLSKSRNTTFQIGSEKGSLYFDTY
jgi:hypothetical protein